MVAASGRSHEMQGSRVTDRPNIIVVMADQQRADSLGCNGNRFCETPNLDRFAGRSVNFVNAFTPFPLCAPARASAWSGLLPHGHGVQENRYDQPDVLATPGGTETVFGRLQHAGYRTAYFGKWHLGTENPGTFDHWSGYNWQGSHWQDSRHDFHGGRYLADLLTDQVIAFLAGRAGDRARSGEAPLCLTVSYGPPHPPYTAPARFYRPYRGRGVPFAGYYAAVSAIDWNVGRLLNAVEHAGLRDDSLVIFIADHGETFMYRPGHKHKQSCYDDAIRVPMIIGAPAGAGAGDTVTAPVGLEDVTPTILDFAGVPAAPDALHGRSLRPWLESKAPADWRDSYYVSNYHPTSDNRSVGLQPQRALRTERWKLIAGAPGLGHQFFDLGLDPEEEIDLLLPRDADHHQKNRHFPDVTDTVVEIARRLEAKADAVDDRVGQLLGQFVCASLDAGTIDPALAALIDARSAPSPETPAES